MIDRRFRVYRKPASVKREGKKFLDEIVGELKKISSQASDYRERSLKIHGLICAK